jgi:hypothetical protein
MTNTTSVSSDAEEAGGKAVHGLLGPVDRFGFDEVLDEGKRTQSLGAESKCGGAR